MSLLRIVALFAALSIASAAEDDPGRQAEPEPGSARPLGEKGLRQVRILE
jgi:hypothetical protein